MKVTAQQIKQAIQSVFAETDKEFIVAESINAHLGFDIRGTVLMRALPKTGYSMKTMVISGHGFLPEYQEEYQAEAEVNIPQIYFGKGGFANYKMGGGVAYVIYKNKSQ